MNKTIKLGVTAILCCGAICSGHSSDLIDEETRGAVKTLETLAGNMARDVWKERKEAADKGLWSFWRTFGPVAGPSLWLNALANGIKQQRDGITALSLIAEYIDNNLANEDIAHPDLGQMWGYFKKIAEGMIPVLNQLDDLEHSVLWRNTRELLRLVGDSKGSGFHRGWENDCRKPPSSQLSTFIDHFRTYLFKDHMAVVKCYIHDCLTPALKQIDQLPDRNTPLARSIVEIVQTQWGRALDLILDSQVVNESDISGAERAMVSPIITLLRNENAPLELGSCYGVHDFWNAAAALGMGGIWSWAEGISESADALVSVIRGGGADLNILLPFVSFLFSSHEEY
jgi:hypothetical protein